MKRFYITSDPVTNIQLLGEIDQEGHLFLHLSEPYKKMTPGDYKDVLMIFHDAKQTIRDMGFDTANVLIREDEKFLKFMQMFGFSVLSLLTNKKGETFIWLEQVL